MLQLRAKRSLCKGLQEQVSLSRTLTFYSLDADPDQEIDLESDRDLREGIEEEAQGGILDLHATEMIPEMTDEEEAEKEMTDGR